MDKRTLEAVKVLMGVVKPGETMLFRLELAGQVLKPGEKPGAAFIVVTVPVMVGQAAATVTSLDVGGN